MTSRPTLPGWRRAAIAAALLVGTMVFLGVVHRHYSVHRWLVWIYLALALGSAGWLLACLAAGHLVLRSLLRLRLPLREHLVLAIAVGVLVFALGMLLLGISGWLHGWAFFLWPALLAAAGGPRLVRDALRWGRRARALAGRWPPRPGAPLAGLARLFGLAGLVLVYLPIMTPGNAAYDARWYHLGLAEHYAALGRIARLPEGWFQGTLPQLATWLYTWAFLEPTGDLFLRIELAAHLEFTLFLATVAGVPVLVRQLTAGRGHRGSWAAVFLFPGLFLYDASLSIGADHVLAFWAVPIALAARRVARAPSLPHGVLAGAMLAGALGTKYQGIYLAVGFVVLVGLGRLGEDAPRPAPAARARALLAAAVAALGLSAGHWLKNWVFHGNPLYPFAHALLGGEPWVEGTVVSIEDPGWRPEGPWWRQAGAALLATVIFSFRPHDWPDWHRDVPVFGSLFTLLALPLLFVPGAGRTWRLTAATLAGVVTWYWTYHQDRYLQSLLPWMAAVTAAALVLLWRLRSWAVRAGVAALVSVQVVWGGDVPFLPTHGMIQRSPYEDTLRLLSTGYRRAFAERHDARSELAPVGRRIPRGALVLLHEEHIRLGLGHAAVADTRGRQGALSYRELGQPDAVHRRLRELGVTHVVWRAEPRGYQRPSDDLVFREFAWGLPGILAVNRWRLAVLGPERPAGLPRPERVAVATCAGLDVLDRLAALDAAWRRLTAGPCPGPEPDAAVTLRIAGDARFLLVDQRLGGLAEQAAGAGWRRLFARDGLIAFGRPG